MGIAPNPGVVAWCEEVREYATFLAVARDTEHLELSIEVDSDPISGWVSNGAYGTRPFSGWIELVAAIEAARCPVAGAGRSGETESETLGWLPGAKAAGL
jgi:hypothetical protein